MRLFIPMISVLLVGTTCLTAQTTAPAIESTPVQNAQAPAPETQAQAAVTTHGDIAVNRLVLSTGVANHEPQGSKDSFSVHDGRVFAFADLSSHGHDHVTFHWTHEGKTHAEVKTPVKDSKRWRTFSSVKALAGSWSVAVQDEHGNVLKEASFNVGHDAPQNAPEAQQAADKNEAATKDAGSIKQVLSSLEPAKTGNAAP